MKNQRAGERVLRSVSHYLEHKLKLQVNTTKSHLTTPAGCKFLGFCFVKRHIKWHAKVEKKFKAEVRRLTNGSKGISMKSRLQKLSRYLRGWINYFGIAHSYNNCVAFDNWIRRRVRMCYWRQWRYTRTKVKQLINRGVPEHLAVSCGATNKGPWRSSKTEGIQMALNNNYLKAQGLVSLRDGWISLHH